MCWLGKLCIFTAGGKVSPEVRLGHGPHQSCLSTKTQMSLPWQIQQLFWSPPIFPSWLFILRVYCPIPVAPPSKGNMNLEVVSMSTSSNILLQLSYMSCSTMYDFSFQVAKSGEDFTSNGSPFSKTLLSCLFRRTQPLIHALHVANHPHRVANHLWSFRVSPSGKARLQPWFSREPYAGAET